MKPRIGTTALVLATIAAGMTLVGAATHSAAARAAASEQRIYLDPDTGEVLAQPPGKADGETAQGGDANGDEPGARQRSLPQAPRAWRNEDGAEMLTPNPDAEPSTRAVRCPDGSLRMGHADRALDNESVREALCRQSND